MKSYEINELLEQMALEGRRYFSPLYICKRLNTENIKEVIALLFSDNYKDIVRPNFEIQCPYGDTDFIVSDLSLISTDTIRNCHHCGTEYTPDLKNIWVTFDFTDDYINHIKKKIKYTLHPIIESKRLLIHV